MHIKIPCCRSLNRSLSSLYVDILWQVNVLTEEQPWLLRRSRVKERWVMSSVPVMQDYQTFAFMCGYTKTSNEVLLLLHWFERWFAQERCNKTHMNCSIQDIAIVVPPFLNTITKLHQCQARLETMDFPLSVTAAQGTQRYDIWDNLRRIISNNAYSSLKIICLVTWTGDYLSYISDICNTILSFVHAASDAINSCHGRMTLHESELRLWSKYA